MTLSPMQRIMLQDDLYRLVRSYSGRVDEERLQAALERLLCDIEQMPSDSAYRQHKIEPTARDQ